MRIRNVVIAAGLALGLYSSTAQASYIINIVQSGSDVVATGSGSIDISGLSYSLSDTLSGVLLPTFGIAVVGSGDIDVYDATISSTSGFGSGAAPVFSDFDTGPVFGIDAVDGQIVVPTGYDGEQLSPSTSTFAKATIAGLGLTPGQYVYTVSPDRETERLALAVNDVIPNTITINIGPSTVPLPASAPMFGAALIALGGLGYGLKRKQAAAAA